MLLHAKAVLAIVVFSFLAVPVFSIRVSEVMHNPDGSDTNREWVEIYNNDSVEHNLTGWKFNSGGSDHTLNVPPANNGTGSMVLAPGSYLIISQDAASFLSDYNFTGTVIDSSWTGLSNSGNETVWIKNSTIIFDNVTYATVPEGNTSCIVNETFTACLPTPGAANSQSGTANTTNSTNSTNPDVRIGVYISAATVNVTYTSLFQVNIDNKTCDYMDNVTVSYNITPSFAGSFVRELACSANSITGSWTPVEAGNYTICGAITNTTANDTNSSNNEACANVTVTQRSCNTSISITSEPVVNSSASFEYTLALSDSFCNETSVDVEYWVEDLFSSYVKAKLNTTQEFSCSKSVSRQWTPDTVTGSEGYRIKAVLRSACDINASDNSAEKLIVVRGSQSSSSGLSSGSSSGSSGGGGGGSGGVSESVTKKNTELLSYPYMVYAGDSFEIVVNVSINRSYSIYSYVYTGNTPVSEWGSKAWDANKKELSTGATVVLPLRIENGTPAGNYTMKVRVKSDKEEDITRQIEILERPNMSVEEANGTIQLTACSGCELLVLAKDFEFSGGNYTLDKPGEYSVLLLKDSVIFSKSKFVIEAPKQNPVTGRAAVKTKAAGLDKRRVFVLQFISRIKLF
ncbi:MAG: hypothetical protein QT00_C0002G0049 [archaeon GW2011_AR5]|nr:MAG: hypothetical protein QT00_C0002G0049 [archaeon GW2011_AR5]